MHIICWKEFFNHMIGFTFHLFFISSRLFARHMGLLNECYSRFLNFAIIRKLSEAGLCAPHPGAQQPGVWPQWRRWERTWSIHHTGPGSWAAGCGWRTHQGGWFYYGTTVLTVAVATENGTYIKHRSEQLSITMKPRSLVLPDRTCCRGHSWRAWFQYVCPCVFPAGRRWWTPCCKQDTCGTLSGGTPGCVGDAPPMWRSWDSTSDSREALTDLTGSNYYITLLNTLWLQCNSKWRTPALSHYQIFTAQQ